MNVPAGLVLLALGIMILLAPAASRPMTPLQARRWTAGLGIGCITLILLLLAYAISTKY